MSASSAMRTSQQKHTPSRACRDAYLRLIQPEIMAWGLQQHPNPASYFGGSDFGYQWDWADYTDTSAIKLATFAILNPGQQLWIGGLRLGHFEGMVTDLPILDDTMGGIFRLQRRWSIRQPLTGLIFSFRQTRSQSIDDAAEHLMMEVINEFPKLRRYLYG
ncbi:hypothetical protein [Mesorhizobium sp. YM1C-6-2]|uniref:hypothetical protein n=1 Tax=Mesorhizobium sp. YM1C-6-2 TaxID=1827501 RepID=UPI0011C46364|nr:hypothetical protein [Mesorhizobium sp. YM1C-6-2]